MKKQWKAHCLVVSFPSQSHVNPMLQFSKRLECHTVKDWRQHLLLLSSVYSFLSENYFHHTHFLQLHNYWVHLRYLWWRSSTSYINSNGLFPKTLENRLRDSVSVFFFCLRFFITFILMVVQWIGLFLVPPFHGLLLWPRNMRLLVLHFWPNYVLFIAYIISCTFFLASDLPLFL